MPSHARRIVLLLAAALAYVSIAVPGVATGAEPEGQIASYDGEMVDLSESWGDATACVVSDDGTAECFDDEAEMDERIVELDAADAAAWGASTTCSTSLRLYDGAGYTGSVLALRGRAMWVNLSGHGFSNRTSSFKMGSCTGYLADLNHGGGGWYPQSATKAGKSAFYMTSGWNNKVSSVYLR